MLADEKVPNWIEEQLQLPPPKPEVKISDILTGKVPIDKGEANVTRLVLSMLVEWFIASGKMPEGLPSNAVVAQVVSLWDDGWLMPLASSETKDGENIIYIEPLIWDGFDYAQPGKKYGEEHDHIPSP